MQGSNAQICPEHRGLIGMDLDQSPLEVDGKLEILAEDSDLAMNLNNEIPNTDDNENPARNFHLPGVHIAQGGPYKNTDDNEGDRKVKVDSTKMVYYPILCAERKQYSEREITYNLLLRKLVDEYMDRTITYSHQPKNVLVELQTILARNFPEFGDSFHRERVCAYLKACRRNAKKKNGEPFVRISARYLSAGMATRLAEQIYMKEKTNMESVVGSTFSQKHKVQEDKSPDQGPTLLTENNFNTIISNVTTTVSEAANETTSFPVDPEPMSTSRPPNTVPLPTNHPSIFLLPGIAERMFAKLLGQTAEFLITVAERIERGQNLFPQSANSPPLSVFK
ncbi:hypothetical protein FBUS_04406 [Fasciolopsis buskii]|uniref:Nucleolar protein 4 helical domain-containing protein n=1 Tax=Fasciolopsis buskii TaxID=27845 RepID=A0A8E0VH09_9TREM|nr:hypothetical protein FBUS_04406 [Fasciolopsis buski]